LDCGGKRLATPKHGEGGRATPLLPPERGSMSRSNFKPFSVINNPDASK